MLKTTVSRLTLTSALKTVKQLALILTFHLNPSVSEFHLVYELQFTAHLVVLGIKDPHLYMCPIYKKPVRTDINYIAAVDLKTTLPPEYWILRGVALLCDVK